MEDDRVEKNRDDQALSPLSAGKVLGIAVLVLIVWLAFAPAKVNPSKPSPAPAAPAPAATTAQADSAKDADYLKAPSIAQEHVETKKEYMASAKKVGGKGDAIYLREFLKNPDKFMGTRLRMLGKIMHIEEHDGETAIQMYVNANMDSVLVHIPESVKVYDGDVINVYGEGAGTFDGMNRMGAAMTWPLIKGKYVVVKRASAD